MAIAEAETGRVSEPVLAQLADLSADTHPARSKAYFERQLDEALKSTNQASYERVRDLLLKLRPVMEKLEQEREFRELLESIRNKYKRRRNLIRTLSDIK